MMGKGKSMAFFKLICYINNPKTKLPKDFSFFSMRNISLKNEIGKTPKPRGDYLPKED